MGSNGDGVSSKKVVFVTVGTTLFDALVRAVDTLEVKQDLYAKGYTHLLIQIGRGSYIPSRSSGGDGSIAVDYFTFSSSIAESLRSASLVISHAVAWLESSAFTSSHGRRSMSMVLCSSCSSVVLKFLFIQELLHYRPMRSGSIFETLHLCKPLIVVVNEDLMDNHQVELAEELAERKHLFCARPQTLHQTIVSLNLGSLLPYPPGDAKPVAKLMNRFLGFPED